MKLFSGSANQPLGKKVAQSLGVSLSPVDVHIFPDGEKRIRISEPVVGEHAFVLQSANTPVDTNYMELFFLIDALKRSGTEFVSAIVPYFGYQRQDHIFREGEAVSLEVMVNILERLGIDRLISFDMHSVRIPDLFRVPVSHLSALPLFAQEIKREGWNIEDTVLASPDMGGIPRVKKLSEHLGGMSYVSIKKTRDLVSGTISSKSLGEGELHGQKRAIIVDDMASSGKTLIAAAEVLRNLGVEEFYAFATHAIFSEDAPSLLEESILKNVYVTDSVLVPQTKQFAKLKILSIADIIAEEIKRLMSS